MSCVHYKFSSKLNYDTVTFDGLHISLCDLKKQIMGREKLKAADSDLQITNAQTKEGKRHMGHRYVLGRSGEALPPFLFVVIHSISLMAKDCSTRPWSLTGLFAFQILASSVTG